MLELGVADVGRAAAWYAAHLDYTVERDDAANGFVLLRRNDSRLALKVGHPARDSVKLHFELPSASALAELAARLTTAGVAVSGPKASAEGYQRVRFADPDGHAVVAFCWVKLEPKSPGFRARCLAVSIPRSELRDPHSPTSPA